MAKGLPARKCVNQGLINLSYALYAVSSYMRGPTLLDLKDSLNADVDTISAGFVTESLGMMAGCVVCK